MTSITVFNNKGGVGKTTLLCNLASYLAVIHKKKVLVIDADPQCNATTYIYPENQLTWLYTRNNQTIYNVINPLSKGKGYFEGKLPIYRSTGFSINVIAGDPRLALSEDLLAEDWLSARSGSARGMQTTTVFAQLLSRCEHYDYVFFDVGPSLGAINRAVLLSSDYFLLPMSSDIFSLRAIENISKSLSNWKKGMESGLNQYFDIEGEPYAIQDKSFTPRLQFLGYVTQQYISKTVRGIPQPVKAYDQIIKRIPQVIEKELVSKFSSNVSLGFQLGQIPNLHSLVPLSQVAKVPIFGLKGRHGVVGAHFAKVKEFAEIIDSVTNSFLSNLNQL